MTTDSTPSPRERSKASVWTTIAARFAHGLGLAAGIVVAGWWVATFWTNQRPEPPPPPEADPPPAATGAAKTTWETKGNWGTLLVQPVFTEKPAHFIDIQPLISHCENWLLPRLTEEEAARWMEKGGLRPEIIRQLMQSNAVGEATGTAVQPPHDLVRQLLPAERAKLHDLLSSDERNTYSSSPFRFSQSVLDHLRHRNNIDPETFAALQSLLYQKGAAYCLSDASTLLGGLGDNDLKKHLFKTLTCTESLLVKIVISPETDLSSIIEYWSGPSNLKDREVLLNSLKETGRVERLDIIHLLPPVPRKLLYSYPATDGQSERRDCHWTSMNFFQESANDDYLDHQLIARELKTDYIDVDQPSKLGDIILLTENGESILHSCIHVAGDIVFTKNGIGSHQPWTLMSIEQVTGFYANGKPLRMLVKRKR